MEVAPARALARVTTMPPLSTVTPVLWTVRPATVTVRATMEGAMLDTVWAICCLVIVPTCPGSVVGLTTSAVVVAVLAGEAVGVAPVLAMSRPPTRSAPTTQTAAVLTTH
jgi:hypothetical protein